MKPTGQQRELRNTAAIVCSGQKVCMLWGLPRIYRVLALITNKAGCSTSKHTVTMFRNFYIAFSFHLRDKG